METIIGTDPEQAARLLKQGELVAIPTETVYGLAGNALDAGAVARIFSAKKRPFFDPLIVHLPDAAVVGQYVAEWPEAARRLAEAFWPGPLTLLLPRKPIIPDLITSGLDTVGIRVPAHPLTLSLLRALPFPLAAPSANPFGYISPTTAEHVKTSLNGEIPYVLDGGACQVGVESTIVGFQQGQAVIYRKGGLSPEAIAEVLGLPDASAIPLMTSSSKPAAPGMLIRHYAPRTPVMVGPDLATMAAMYGGVTASLGILAFHTPLPNIPLSRQFVLSPGASLTEAAQNLFTALRFLDNLGATLILAEWVPDHGLGLAINDRLSRAAEQP